MTKRSINLPTCATTGCKTAGIMSHGNHIYCAKHWREIKETK